MINTERLEHYILQQDEAKGIKPREETKKLHDVRDGEGSGDSTLLKSMWSP